MTETSRPNTTLYIGNLDPTTVTPSLLQSHFIPFGEILSTHLPKPEAPSSTDLHRGFGYVEFEDASDAKEAISNMDQSELGGRVIKVAVAREDQRRDHGGGVVGRGAERAVWEMEGGRDVGMGVEEVMGDGEEVLVDPMDGLRGLDVAGPSVE